MKKIKRSLKIDGFLFSHLFSLWYLDSGLLKLLKDVVQIYDEKTANMLPETDEDLRQIAFHGIGWNTITKRTPEWVKDNGQCIDQLRAGKSTIEQAGRGAFAKYFIAKGGLVAPLPFLQILNKDELNMYKTKMHEGTNIKYADYDKLVGQQLILNYCFTHNESTLLLCPVSLAALINHKSTRSQNADGPNAHYRWSQWEKSTSEWLDLSFGEIGEVCLTRLFSLLFANRNTKICEHIESYYLEKWTWIVF